LAKTKNICPTAKFQIKAESQIEEGCSIQAEVICSDTAIQCKLCKWILDNVSLRFGISIMLRINVFLCAFKVMHIV